MDLIVMLSYSGRWDILKLRADMAKYVQMLPGRGFRYLIWTKIHLQAYSARMVFLIPDPHNTQAANSGISNYMSGRLPTQSSTLRRFFGLIFAKMILTGRW